MRAGKRKQNKVKSLSVLLNLFRSHTSELITFGSSEFSRKPSYSNWLHVLQPQGIPSDQYGDGADDDGTEENIFWKSESIDVNEKKSPLNDCRR